jgi:hypothetical protein
MKIVSQKTIDSTISYMDEMKEEDVSKLVQSFADEQPGVMALIMAQEEDFSENDFDALIDLTLLIFLCFKNECGKMRTLTIEEVEAMDDKQMAHLEYLETLNEVDLEIEMSNVIVNSKQPFILEYITEELTIREEEGEFEDESGAAYFFPQLQLVIDLFDAAANGSFLKIVQ